MVNEIAGITMSALSPTVAQEEDETPRSLEICIAALRLSFVDARDAVEARGFDDDVEMKSRLMKLYRDVDTALGQCGQLKDEIRQFVGQWKAKLSGCEFNGEESSQSHSTGSSESKSSGESYVVHTDHLGASTYLEKGWTKISTGDYEGAELTLMRALELSPKHIEAQALLGWAQMLQDKLDAALMNFHDVLSREPTNALARINVGYICLKKGIFGEAIEHLSRALREDNDSRAVLYANFYLGLVYIEREMYEDAQAFFERAISLGPNLVEAYFELGHACWLAGKPDEAASVWQRGATVNKYNAWSQRCEEIVTEIEEGRTPKRVWLSRGE